MLTPTESQRDYAADIDAKIKHQRESVASLARTIARRMQQIACEAADEEAPSLNLSSNIHQQIHGDVATLLAMIEARKVFRLATGA